MDGLESLLYVAGIESDQRILPNFSAADRFSFDFVDGALGALLRERRDGQKDQSQSGC
jgi:hypothetical protein